MDRLWAPWRMAYVAGHKPPASAKTCFLCTSAAEDRDRENLVVGRGATAFVVLNRFPYNNGHLLVSPKAHKARLDELTPDEHLEIMLTMQRLVGILQEIMNPQGFNIGVNLGRAAGAGLPGHLHWHLVPRWDGDTNFMTVLDDTQIIVQSLEALYDLLAPRLRA